MPARHLHDTSAPRHSFGPKVSGRHACFWRASLPLALLAQLAQYLARVAVLTYDHARRLNPQLSAGCLESEPLRSRIDLLLGRTERTEKAIEIVALAAVRRWGIACHRGTRRHQTVHVATCALGPALEAWVGVLGCHPVSDRCHFLAMHAHPHALRVDEDGPSAAIDRRGVAQTAAGQDGYLLAHIGCEAVDALLVLLFSFASRRSGCRRCDSVSECVCPMAYIHHTYTRGGSICSKWRTDPCTTGRVDTTIRNAARGRARRMCANRSRSVHASSCSPYGQQSQ